MPELLHLLHRYGYPLLFANLFLEAVGLPIPSVPILIAAGAACALGTLNFPLVLALALAAMVFGDLLLYLTGRFTGWALLGFLCRLSSNPETCLLKSAQSFYRRGRLTLVFAKFIPGINTMAPPLAGSMNMSLPQFLGLDFLATLIYVLPFVGLGFFFNHLVVDVVDGFRALTRSLEILAIGAIAAYFGYRLRYLWTHTSDGVVPRVSGEELAGKMDADFSNVLVADTRSHGYYDAGASRIKGSVRLEPNHLLAEMEKLPKDKEIYLYCT